jgi:hypothetical protein
MRGIIGRSITKRKGKSCIIKEILNCGFNVNKGQFNITGYNHDDSTFKYAASFFNT